VRHPRLVLAIFILSGAAGLMYEVVWSRQLVLVFGNTTQAVSTILTGFFGGMAVGSFLGGRLADRVRSPLRLYGIIEIVLVVVVLLTPVTFRLLHEVYRGVFPAIEGQPIVLALIRFVLTVLALAPATVLMGATLPTLTRSLTHDGHLSAAFGRLYAANTLGAIVGTLVAGLVLIELLGLTGTLLVAAAFSATAGVVAVLLGRGGDARTAVATTPRPSPGVAVAQRPTLALLLAFVSGLTSLGYQVLWTRLLSSGTGNSTYVFTLILGMFLIGITIGAAIFAATRQAIRQPIGLIAMAQVAVRAHSRDRPSRRDRSGQAPGSRPGHPDPDHPGGLAGHDRDGLHVPGRLDAPGRRSGADRRERRKAACREHARGDRRDLRDPVLRDSADRLTKRGRAPGPDQHRDRGRSAREA